MIINFMKKPLRSCARQIRASGGFSLPAIALACACSLAGCSAPGGTTAAADSGTFIALASDLDNFHSWQSYDAGNETIDQVHTDGARTVYINCTSQPGFHCAPPRHGQTQFDIGTLIVKEGPAGDGGSPQIFAMAKRGGGYNTGGATNWEWFDIQNTGSGDSIQIIWRGDGPPQSDSYGATHESCNECHSALSDQNDFVSSPPLQLSNF